MRTETVRNIVSETEQFQWLIPDGDTEDSSFASPDELATERLAELAKKWKVDPNFVIEVNDTFRGFREAVFSDLAALLKRIEALESRNIPQTIAYGDTDKCR